jgi:hypothetical protein
MHETYQEYELLLIMQRILNLSLNREIAATTHCTLQNLGTLSRFNRLVVTILTL